MAGMLSQHQHAAHVPRVWLQIHVRRAGELKMLSDVGTVCCVHVSNILCNTNVY